MDDHNDDDDEKLTEVAFTWLFNSQDLFVNFPHKLLHISF